MSDDLSLDEERTAALIAAAEALAAPAAPAARAPKPQRPPVAPTKRTTPRAKGVVIACAGVAVLALAGLTIRAIAGGDDDTATSTTGSPASSASATSTSVTAAASSATTSAVVAPTLPPPAVTLPPTTTAPAAAASSETTTATSVAPAAVSLSAPTPLSAEQKGELLVLSGSVSSEQERQTVLAQVGSLTDKSKIRDQTYVAAGSPPPSQAFNLLLRDGLQFESDQATLTGVTATLALDSLAQILAARPTAKVRIEGHTDSAGDAAHNRALAGRRIEAAVAYLASKGVDRARIEQVPVGEDRPIAENDTPEGRRINRRLELTITGLL